jgi:hypothetical protein
VPTTAKYDAWIIGVHQFPDEPEAREPLKFLHGEIHGQVLIHDITFDRWSVLPEDEFNRLYEWV